MAGVVGRACGRSAAPPRGSRWRPQAIELAGLVVGIALYSWLHNLAGSNVILATANAHAVQSIERALGLDVEVSANHWLAGQPALITAAVWYYRLYYLPLAAVLLWLLLRHYGTYRHVRVALIVMATLALLLFWLLPMSPPRFAEPGIIDIVAQHDVIAGSASRDLTTGQNHFSAFPSLHVGWSALCGYAGWQALRIRHRRLGMLTWLFPLVMVAVVIATGNHYVLDVLGSAVLLAISVGTAHGWDRFRRRCRPSTDLS